MVRGVTAPFGVPPLWWPRHRCDHGAARRSDDVTVIDDRLGPVYDELVRRNPGETEFHQAAHEVLSSLGPVLDRNPQYVEQIFKNSSPACRSAVARAARTSTPRAGPTARSCASASRS
ncbi:hypothetical protein GCM10025864_28860 [Luteimicrobium album]|uniref:Uncharacterized protein n=1 Tax=Luteimicrobium album TaxID=1054550 RepID=A0ABQ6I4I4_9MICO|nr:hypothetical protein GCM10025864_28860 [Luteimicrobium album]